MGETRNFKSRRTEGVFCEFSGDELQATRPALTGLQKGEVAVSPGWGPANSAWKHGAQRENSGQWYSATVIFKQTFILVLDLQKWYQDNTGSPWKLRTQFPPLLRSSISVIHLSQLIKRYRDVIIHQSPHFVPISLVFTWPSSVQDGITRLWVSQTCLVFDDLDHFAECWQCILWKDPSWSCLMFFSWWDWGYGLGEEVKGPRAEGAFSSHHRGCLLHTWLITGLRLYWSGSCAETLLFLPLPGCTWKPLRQPTLKDGELRSTSLRGQHVHELSGKFCTGHLQGLCTGDIVAPIYLFTHLFISVGTLVYLLSTLESNSSQLFLSHLQTLRYKISYTNTLYNMGNIANIL